MKNLLLIIHLLGIIQCGGKAEKITSTFQKEEDRIPIEQKKNLGNDARHRAQDNPCPKFNILNTKIRDGEISQKEAQTEIKTLIPEVTEYFYTNGGKDYSQTEWYFPVKGYGKSAIGGTNGSGYLASGYNYFDGNKHKGHPAHDIFINDKNQDNLEDKTLKPVEVLSVSGGVVVATEPEWDTQSSLRGGIYVWIYDPFSKSLFYYAHNQSLSISVGEIVVPGQKIAEVGRTGLNAFKERSPTHLHITRLIVSENGVPESKDIYPQLIAAKQ